MLICKFVSTAQQQVIYCSSYVGKGKHETLLLTVEALKAQLEEQTKMCKEQVKLL